MAGDGWMERWMGGQVAKEQVAKRVNAESGQTATEEYETQMNGRAGTMRTSQPS